MTLPLVLFCLSSSPVEVLLTLSALFHNLLIGILLSSLTVVKPSICRKKERRGHRFIQAVTGRPESSSKRLRAR